MRTQYFLENKNVDSIEGLTSPRQLHLDVPASSHALRTVRDGRRTLENILHGQDPRLFVVVGPCSIHDPQAAVDYARRLAALQSEVASELVLVMRVYFEKPRTTVGWKGLINDPEMDDSFDIDRGLRIARQLMVELSDLGLPLGTEALDPLSPQYLGDLVSWSAIGARTTESQTHREMASGLSTPVGFKNGTDGGLAVAINAMLSAQRPHAFLGIDRQGQSSVVRTHGNPHGHLILRGGAVPNYQTVDVQKAKSAMVAAGLPARLVVDCSHGNSSKNHERQVPVLEDVVGQRIAGETALMGVMLESNLVAGQQKAQAPRSSLTYGQSVTDACIDWASTEKAILSASARLKRG